YLFSITNLKVLPKSIIELPRRAAINFHDGPLPRYAGVHATTWAILNGETSHAVTWHLMTADVDEGDILKQRAVAVTPEETSYSLNVRCYQAGVESFADLVEELTDGTNSRRKQDLSQRTYFARHKRPVMAATVSWNQPAAQVSSLVRALEFGPTPNRLGCAKILVGSGYVLCSEVEVLEAPSNDAPGTIMDVSETGITVAAADHPIVLRRLFSVEGQELESHDVVPLQLFKGMRLEAPSAALSDRITRLDSQLSRHESYWVRALSGLEPPSLPFLNTSQATNGASQYQHAELEIRDLVPSGFLDLPSGEKQATVLAAFAMCMARLGPKLEFDIGVMPRELGDVIDGLEGLFAAHVPLKVQCDPSDSFARHCRRLVSAMDEVTSRQTFGRDVLTRYAELRGLRERGLHQSLPIRVELAGTDTTQVPRAAAALCLAIPERADHCRWIYDANAVAADSIAVMMEQFGTFLREALSKPAEPVGNLSLISGAEKHKLLDEWNETSMEYPVDRCIHEAFEEQVDATPDSVAVVCRTEELTYRELNAQANQVAHYLRSIGVKADSLVGLAVERSVDMMIGLLGILKAGAAYIPLDPSYPNQRLALMIEDSGMPVLLTQESVTEHLPSSQARVIKLDTERSLLRSQPSENPPGAASSSNLAYVIYTSGSTGKPKGVMIEHRNVMNFFAGMDVHIHRSPESTWLAATSFSFDISVLELLWTLTRGAKVVLFAEESSRPATLIGSSKPVGKSLDFSLFYFAAGAETNASDRYRLLIEGAKYADQHGFAAIWTPERHFHQSGGLYPNPSVTSAALAMVTRKVQLRSGSVVAPLHHPARIAEEWSVVDNLSGGRAGISFASGWMSEDFVIRPDSYAAREEMMFESLDIVRSLWRGEEVPFSAPDGGDVRVRTLPRPVQSDLPVWVTTAGNPETFQRAGEVGANVLTHLLGQSIGEVAEKVALYRRAWKKAGHPGAGSVALMLHAFVGSDEELVKSIVRDPLIQYLGSSADLIKKYSSAFPAFKKGGAAASKVTFADVPEEDMRAILEHAFERYFETSGLLGTPETCAERVESIRSAGIDEIACLIDFGVDPDVVLASLPQLAAVKEQASRAQPKAGGGESAAALIRRHRVTHFQCTPSLAKMLIADPAAREAISSLRQLLVGGEALPSPLAAELNQIVKGDVLNMYGPTETTIWSTVWHVPDEPAGVKIGRPIANTEIYLLNGAHQPVATGVASELMIGGAGV
ncbi:MAG: LLM class flavin-dependent oxidoreductase, partial [Candidatus Eisenbacteria bacterium]|nr:LLM class flavin-dependent oxidoreductase [Candidatus Eisenbacteria bacterium]